MPSPRPPSNVEGARAALKELDGVRVEGLDLVDPASVDAFTERFLAESRPLHLLITNAGVMATPLTRDARGNELQFAVNHLGHFRLATRLWPALVAASGARVVRVKTVEQGAATTVWCATSPALDGLGGVYCEDCDISPLVSAEELAASAGLLDAAGVLPYAVDQDAAARLWEVSEALTER